MKFKDKILLAYEDIINRKFRSFLTLLIISVGSLLLILMMGFGDAISDKARKTLESFGTINAVTITSMERKFSGNNIKKITDSDLSKIKSISGVESVRAFIKANATSAKAGDGEYIDNNINVGGVAFKYNINFSGDILEGSSFLGNENEILLGEELLKKFGIEDSKDAIEKIIRIKIEEEGKNGIKIKEPIEVEGEIVGITNEKSAYGSSILMSDKLAGKLAAYYIDGDSYIEDIGYDSVSVFGADGINIIDLNKEIKEETGLMTFSSDLIDNMLDIMTGVIKSILSFTGIIVVIVASLGVVNTMTMTLEEKKNMIGVMRVVGASKRNIKEIFLLQSFMLGLAGGVLGSIISSMIIIFVSEYVTKIIGLTIPISLFNVFLSISITTIVSVIAGIIPARRAIKLDVVEALSVE